MEETIINWKHKTLFGFQFPRFAQLIAAYLSCLIFTLAIQPANAALPDTNQSYAIEVNLNPETRMLKGRVEITWNYSGNMSIREIPVNLYLNAFSHSETTWMREKHQVLSADEKRELFEEMQELQPDPWGYSKLLSVEQNGRPIKWQAIQPDDGNVLDNTLIKLILAEPVSKDKPLLLTINFEAKLPVTIDPMRRTGGFGDYFFMAQWYPKLSMHEEGIGFVKSQFHAATEFYAEFADYRVEITAPKNWTVGATGKQTQKSVSEQETAYVFQQKAVHDFAFLVAKNFTDHIEHIKKSDGSELEVHYLLEQHLKYQIPRFHTLMEKAVAKFEKYIGPYPYQTLSLVFPTYAHRQTTGMEYPTLITIMPTGEILDRFPLNEFRLPEMMILHEFGHQYFFGLFASNERQNAFLDEGLNSYWEARFMSEIYGETSSLGKVAGRKVDGLLLGKAGSSAAGQIRESIRKQPSWLYYPGSTGRQVYSRPADTLMTAGNLYGTDIIDDIFDVYYQDYVFKHPRQKDFLHVVKTYGGQDVFNLISEGLSQPRLPNYKIAYLESEPWQEPLGYSDESAILIEHINQLDSQQKVWAEITDPGWFDSLQQFTREGSVEVTGEQLVFPDGSDPHKPAEFVDASKSAAMKPFYQSKVRIEGPAWMHLPVTLRFTFSGGQVLNKTWDGRAAWRAYRFLSKAKLIKVQIDPENHITLDNDPSDNSLSTEPDKLFVWEKSTWLAGFLQWLSSGVLTWM